MVHSKQSGATHTVNQHVSKSFKVSPGKIKSLYLHIYLLSWRILMSVFFFFSFWISLMSHFCRHIISLPFRGKLAALSTLSLHLPPSLQPSSIYSITWQESWYFPWDSMSYCPLTASNSAHAPPPLTAFAQCLLTTQNASVHFKSKSCAATLLSPRPHFPPGFPRHASFRVKGCHSFTNIFYFPPLFISHPPPSMP